MRASAELEPNWGLRLKVSLGPGDPGSEEGLGELLLTFFWCFPSCPCRLPRSWWLGSGSLEGAVRALLYSTPGGTRPCSRKEVGVGA